MHLVIIGHRGSGKTTIGHAVAVRLGSAFIDLDDATLSRFRSPSVIEVWKTHGEQAWREAEAAALADLRVDRVADAATPPLVIALGGGTPTVFEAQQTLREAKAASAAFVVWLRAPVETIVARLDADPGDRPILTAAVPSAGASNDDPAPGSAPGSAPDSDVDPVEHHRCLLERREPIYAELADAAIDATMPVADATQAVIDAWLAAHNASS